MVNVFDYFDYRCYLKGYFQEQKEKNPSYSYKRIANKAGFKSKSFFHEVIAGKKNLSKDSVFSLRKVLNLNEKSFSYFEVLVAYTQADGAEQKEHFYKKLLEFNKRSASSLIRKDQYDYFSQWYHLTIREILGMAPFKDDYALLAQAVRPAISTRQAKESVKLLERLGLIRKKGDRYELSDKSITTGDEVESMAIKKYQKKNLEMAASALYDIPARERDITNIVGALCNSS